MSTELQFAIERLRDEIRDAELRCARIGDEWLKKVQRSDITAMRHKLRELEEKAASGPR